ncbi:MAG TPA: tetratricopeptide repeat protein [Myxococcaceae bacterium]|nr:tetratricopeptide repeat protein [Myxococcaceae bacterium]
MTVPSDREVKFRQMAAQFPDAPLAHFSLGKVLLEERRFAEAAGSLARATHLDAHFAAAWVSLGDAHAGAGQSEGARSAWSQARALALAQGHPELAEEIDERIAEL